MDFLQALITSITEASVLDIVIIIVGLYTILCICHLMGKRRQYEKNNKLAENSKWMKRNLRRSIRYQWGIDVCPLLGTLGTVVGLINNTVSGDLEKNFLLALTTTFWGLLFAILCKMLESFSGINGYFEELAELKDRNVEEKRELVEE